jgi:hypothetical protein
MRRVITALGLAALTLFAACSKKSDAPAPASNAAAPAPAAAPTPTAAAADPASATTADQLPAPKAGLWERTSSQDGAAAETDRHCADGKPIDPMSGGPKCAKMNISRTPTGGYIIDADCPNNGVDAKLHGTIEGDVNSAYTSDTTMTMSQAGTPAMVTKNHSTWKYVGACPAGQAPS